MFACLYGQKIPEGVSLSSFAYAFSPLVEETALDTSVIDTEGCELRFGSSYGLASEITNHARRSKAAGGLGHTLNVALAGNPDTAILAARHLSGITFVSPGEELTALGDLPIEKLFSATSASLTAKPQSSKSKTSNARGNSQTLNFGSWTLDHKEAQGILETLKLWGVLTFRDFAALPITGVAERLGQEGIRLQQLASGKTERHLTLRQSPPVFEYSFELEHALAELEPLSFIFARLLNQLCASLDAHALATNELRVRMKLEAGTSHERTLSLPSPMRDHKAFLKLLLLDTEMHPPQEAVIAVSIAGEPVKPRTLQNGLFIPQAPEPEKLELTLARLAKLVGSGNVGSPELVNTHRPDAFCLKRFVIMRGQGKGRSGEAGTRRRGDAGRMGRGEGEMRRYGDAGKEDDSLGSTSSPVIDPRITASPRLRVFEAVAPPLEEAPPAPIVGFRVFRPPLRAMVEGSSGYPTQVSAWGANRSVYGKVVQLAGPWRTTGDWWRDDGWARDEWDVAIEGRAAVSSLGGEAGTTPQVLYRIYRELKSGSWFVEGAYD